MRFARLLLPLTAIAGAFLASACGPQRVHRVTDFQYIPKAPDAPIDLFIGELTRPYEPIAVVDSQRYESKSEAKKAEMLGELEALARPLGADAVHNVRLLHARVRGIIPDERPPVPGAWRQGVRYMYFLRGQAVKYVDQVGREPSRMAHEPAVEPAQPEETKPGKRPELEIAPAEVVRPEPIRRRRVEVAEPEEPIRATPRTLREPEVAGDE